MSIPESPRRATKAYVDAVARHLATRLHRGEPDVRCRCGQCRHLIVVTAARTGIEPRRLVRALPPEAKPPRETPRVRASLRGQVSSSMTVLSDGELHQGPTVVLALLRTTA